MPLSTNQQTQLRNAILAEPAVAAFLAAGDDGSIAAYYNAPSGTAAWGENVSARTLDEGANYAAFDGLVAGKREAWALFLQYAPRDMSVARNRNVVTDVWGNATTNSTAAAILTACTVDATRAEALFGGAVTSTGTVSALRRSWAGVLSAFDIAQALRG